MLKLWITPVTKEVEVVEVVGGRIVNREKVDPVEAIICGVMGIYSDGLIKEVSFTDNDDNEWEVKFSRKGGKNVDDN